MRYLILRVTETKHMIFINICEINKLMKYVNKPLKNKWFIEVNHNKSLLSSLFTSLIILLIIKVCCVMSFMVFL